MAKNKARRRAKPKFSPPLKQANPTTDFDLSPFEAMVASMHLIRHDIATKNCLFDKKYLESLNDVDMSKVDLSLIRGEGSTLVSILPGFLAKIPTIENQLIAFITDVRNSAFANTDVQEREDEILRLNEAGQAIHEEYSGWIQTYTNAIQPIHVTIIEHLSKAKKPVADTTGGVK